MLLFCELVDETQISKPPEPTRHLNSIKLWILLPLRAKLLVTLQYEIPCSFQLYSENQKRKQCNNLSTSLTVAVTTLFVDCGVFEASYYRYHHIIFRRQVT